MTTVPGFRGTLRLVNALRELPELRDVSSDQQDQGLQVWLDIDRNTASRFGVTPRLVVDTLYDAFGQRRISTIFKQLNRYRVVLEVKPDYRQNPDKLNSIYIRGARGGNIHGLGSLGYFPEIVRLRLKLSPCDNLRRKQHLFPVHSSGGLREYIAAWLGVTLSDRRSTGWMIPRTYPADVGTCVFPCAHSHLSFLVY